jgi:hypothetical protein
MASFCYDCTSELIGDPEDNDFAGIVDQNERLHCLCEGCGWITVDEDGRRLEPE